MSSEIRWGFAGVSLGFRWVRWGSLGFAGVRSGFAGGRWGFAGFRWGSLGPLITFLGGSEHPYRLWWPLYAFER